MKKQSNSINLLFMKKSALLLILLLLVGGVAYFWLSMNSQSKKGPPPIAVKISTVQRQDIPLNVAQVGNVIAYETVAVRSRIDSQIMQVAFKDGEAVAKDALLFVLDDRALRAQENELEANLKRDRAQLENFRQQFDRAAALKGKGFVSTASLDNAKAAYKAQEATALATEAELANVRVQLGYTRITAPISGRTGTINVTAGNTVKANDTQPLVTINQIKPIRVQMALAQQYLDKLRSAKQAGEVEVLATRQDSPSVSRGKLEYIDNAVDQTTGTFVVRAVFDNEDEALWPGVFVNTTLTLDLENGALVIPEVAVQHGQAGEYVYVIQDEKAKRREIKVSRNQDNLAVIANGLQENEQVVTDGTMQLKDGATVSTKASESAAP